ncbi:MAG: DUF3291 domain-containing protein [Pseudomonadota bacterium]
MSERYLAHFNFARLALSLDDPRLAGFMHGRDPIRRIAESCNGFVWKQDVGAGEGAVAGDPAMLLSLSVWKTPEALWHFAWNTLHKRFWRRRAEWFEAPSGPSFAMWWVAPEHRPTHDEGWDRIAYLCENGASDRAFGWDWLPRVTDRNQQPLAAE